MKLTKIAGAFALTAAMAMSAVPAFAAAEATNVDNFKETSTTNEASAQTKVYAETVNAALNATVPTRVAVVLPSSGGGDVTCPSAEAYKIINKGSAPIYLKKVQSAGTGFSLAATAPTSGNTNTLALKVNAGSFEAILDGSDKTPGTGAAPEITANNGELGLALSGKSWVGSTLSSAQLESAIMTITYTIGTVR